MAHRPALLRMLRRLLPTPEDAEDVLQESLLHAFVGLAGLRWPELFGPWLRTVAHNRAMQFQRRHYAEVGAWPRLWTPKDGDGGIAARVGRLDAEAALGLLSARDRDAVVLRYVRGWTAADIARAQGTIAATVRWRLGRARTVLRRGMWVLESSPARTDRAQRGSDPRCRSSWDGWAVRSAANARRTP